MSKRTISLFVTVLLAIALFGLYFFQINCGDGISEHVNNDARTVTADSGVRLINRSESDVIFVSINETITEANPNAAGYRFNRADGQWVIESHPDYILDQRRVREKVRFAWDFTVLGVAHEDMSDAGLSDFGLNPPFATAIAYYSDGSQSGLFIGDYTADLTRRFIMFDNDNAVYLISSTHAEQILYGINDLLDRSFPSPFMGDISYMYIERQNNPVIELTMMELRDIVIHLGLPDDEDVLSSRYLAMNRPLPGREFYADIFDDEIMSRFRAFRIGDAVSVSPDDLSLFGLDEPSLIFEYESGRGNARLYFGNIFDRDGIAFIYVKFAGRSHVFEAEYAPVSVLMNLNIFPYIDRYFTLINITDVEGITAGDFDIKINHGNDNISPNINGRYVNAADFRTVYRLIVGLTIDALIEPTEPYGTPDLTITFERINNPGTEIRLFTYDANFYSVSIDGGEMWFNTSRRDINTLLAMLGGL